MNKDVELPQWLDQAIDDIDSALYTGDTFQDANMRGLLKEYVERWQRHIKEIEEGLANE